MKTLILALVSTLLVSVSHINIGYSQTSLQGKVTDLASGEPILFGTVALIKDGTTIKGVETDLDGNYYFSDIKPGTYEVEASYVGYTPSRLTGVLVTANKSNRLDLQISEGVLADEIVITEYKLPMIEFDNTSSGSIVTSEDIRNLPTKSVNSIAAKAVGVNSKMNGSNASIRGARTKGSVYYIDGVRVTDANLISQPPAMEYHEEKEVRFHSNESYSTIVENQFVNPTDEALSTFSIDVDRAGYSNVRRFIDGGQLPPKDAIRIEEMINYFDYDYKGPSGSDPFAIHKSLVECPWNEKHQMLHVALQGSTAGGAGIQLAYKTAKKHFIKNGNNRVILATDGDFNVGTSSNMGLEELIEKERKSGVFLSVLGYGMGNYKDSKMQILADKGNGNHAYIDNIQEARKIFVSEFAGTLFTIAKDVKIQIEFNPAHVQAYRLIGYENRMLQKEDFNNDKIDAGELGAGHTVTALYEIIPTGVESSYVGSVDDLKYQKVDQKKYNLDSELATIKLRYKKPDGKKSKKIEKTISNKSMQLDDAPEHVRFAMSVAQFGLALRKSDYLNSYDMSSLIQLAEAAKSHDPEGYKAECIRLMKSAQLMDSELMAGQE